MAPAVYTPAAAASVVGVHPNSIRDWCKQYASHLSAGANPPAGQPRQLSPVDVARLQLVAQWRADGHPVETVAERLAQLPENDPPQPYIQPDPGQESPTAPQISDRSSPSSDAAIAPHSQPTAVDVSAVMHDLAVLVDSRHDRTVERLTAIDERLAAIEQRRHGLVMLAVGLGLGVLVTAVAVLLVRLIGGG